MRDVDTDLQNRAAQCCSCNPKGTAAFAQQVRDEASERTLNELLLRDPLKWSDYEHTDFERMGLDLRSIQWVVRALHAKALVLQHHIDEATAKELERCLGIARTRPWGGPISRNTGKKIADAIERGET